MLLAWNAGAVPGVVGWRPVHYKKEQVNRVQQHATNTSFVGSVCRRSESSGSPAPRRSSISTNVLRRIFIECVHALATFFEVLRLQCRTVPVWVSTWVGLAINVTRQEAAPPLQDALVHPKVLLLRNRAPAGSWNALRSYEAMRPA